MPGAVPGPPGGVPIDVDAGTGAVPAAVAVAPAAAGPGWGSAWVCATGPGTWVSGAAAIGAGVEGTAGGGATPTSSGAEAAEAADTADAADAAGTGAEAAAWGKAATTADCATGAGGGGGGGRPITGAGSVGSSTRVNRGSGISLRPALQVAWRAIHSMTTACSTRTSTARAASSRRGRRGWVGEAVTADLWGDLNRPVTARTGPAACHRRSGARHCRRREAAGSAGAGACRGQRVR
jgi:hypothetical protein